MLPVNWAGELAAAASFGGAFPGASGVAGDPVSALADYDRGSAVALRVGHGFYCLTGGQIRGSPRFLRRLVGTGLRVGRGLFRRARNPASALGGFYGELQFRRWPAYLFATGLVRLSGRQTVKSRIPSTQRSLGDVLEAPEMNHHLAGKFGVLARVTGSTKHKVRSLASTILRSRTSVWSKLLTSAPRR